MECYACDNEATRQCRRCARVYCELHGGDLCAECMSPASALPSFNLYRGSLLALLVGTAVALWLLVRPPGSGEEAVVVAGVTPTGIVTEVDEGTTTPDRTPSPTAGTATPAGTATSTPAPTAAPTNTPGPRTYRVQQGDTLLSIAEENAPPGVSAVDYANRIAAANGISPEDIINPGEELVLP
jgi:hypothetical protein